MKVITDYFALKHCKETVVEEPVVNDDEEVYYEARKIKIRLADPNVPDSYVCEIYDTSVEEAVTEIVTEAAGATSMDMTSHKRKPRRKRLRGKVVEQRGSSSSDDEALISMRKRLRASNEPNLDAKNSKRENVLRPTNPENKSLPSNPKRKIGDYFAVDNKLVSKPDNKKNDLENVKANVPLAPVFRMAVRKPKEAEEVLKARRNFLHSGLPKKTQKAAAALKVLKETNTSFFPDISHVQQKSNELIWTKRWVDLVLKDLEEYNEHPLIWNPCLTRTKPAPVRNFKPSNTKKINKNKLKTAYKNVNIDALHDALKEMHNASEGFSVWSEKYQPTTESMFKDTAVNRLKTWLTSWKQFGDFARPSSKATDSSDDFVSSDDEASSRKPPPTACLLQGPVGCGKTAVVRALASELDFHILEINSSSKRSGKKMLTDLQEATKSHKILQEAGNIAKPDTMSVIVIEEADVVFDQDEGFVSGLQTLIATAKRPVLMLTNDATVQHLEKFSTKQTLQLTMKRPQLFWSCAVLELIALFEGASPPRAALSALLHKNNLDLRRSILELQFWVQKAAGVNWDKMSNESLSLNSVSWNEKCGVKQNTKEFFQYCDNLSVCDVARRKTAFAREFFAKKAFIKDGCCLEENMMGTDKVSVLQDEIESEILRLSTLRLNTVKQSSGVNANFSCNTIAQSRAMDELLQLVPQNSIQGDKFIDFLPILRQICRCESERQESNGKRGNRFYHYLQTIGIKPTRTNLDINRATFTTPLN